MTIAPARDGEGVAAVTLDSDIGCAFESPMQAGEAISVSIRPETIMLKALTGEAASDVNRVRRAVGLSGFLGAMNRYTVKVGLRALQVEANGVFEAGAEVALEFSRKAALGVAG